MQGMELLSVRQMRDAEKASFKTGTDSYVMMMRAGRQVAHVAACFSGREFLVLAGPGNNGGDGFIAAQALLEAGEKLRVALWQEKGKPLKGDAARAAQVYRGKTIALPELSLSGNPVIIDALFGIGLSRPITGSVAKCIRTINAQKCDVIAVDIPSGVDGDSGAILGVALKAGITVTFAAKKYGHVLMPGRINCGEVIVADIGITPHVITSQKPQVVENSPDLWLKELAWPRPEGHKYDRGHTLIIAGPAKRAGAAKLSGLGALRAGSGLVSLVCAKKDLRVYASRALSLMTQTRDEWKTLLNDKRNTTVVIGPGAGVGASTRALVLAALKAGKRMVIDADALSSFASHAKTLFSAIHSPCVLTPHSGEFARLFPAMKGSKLEMAQKAAQLSRAVVILKGYDTVIAAPDGRTAINTNAPAELATAGSGDVLAGICAGLLAQGMDPFKAACAAVWIHGEAAQILGAGLIAEDIPACLPQVLKGLKKKVVTD